MAVILCCPKNLRVQIDFYAKPHRATNVEEGQATYYLSSIVCRLATATKPNLAGLGPIYSLNSTQTLEAISDT
jgi:hypothetical protein